jgi:hypothetical protein
LEVLYVDIALFTDPLANLADKQRLRRWRSRRLHTALAGNRTDVEFDAG